MSDGKRDGKRRGSLELAGQGVAADAEAGGALTTAATDSRLGAASNLRGAGAGLAAIAALD